MLHARRILCFCVHITRLNRPTKDDSKMSQIVPHADNTTRTIHTMILLVHPRTTVSSLAYMQTRLAVPHFHCPEARWHSASAIPTHQHQVSAPSAHWETGGSTRPQRQRVPGRLCDARTRHRPIQPEAIRSSERSTASSLSSSRSRKQECVPWPRGVPSGKISSLDLPGTKHATMKTKRGELIKNL
jgi:hypothetical protein